MNLSVMLSKIKFSSNYRETIDEKSIDELAESIKKEGLLQPIMLNQVDMDTYNIIFGHRRYLAAKKAGLVSVPSIVRENLSDEEVLSLQLIENVQRKDVAPWEEAAAFKKLSKTMPINQISATVGKHARYISLRIALCELNEFWMELLKVNKIELSAALMIARLPEVAQVKLKDSIVEGEVPKTKEIEALIRNKIMLILKNAGFPLETEFGKCGISCLSCTKRTGGNELFPDISDNDYCLDSSCFDDKKKTHIDQNLNRIYTKYPDIVRITDGWRNIKLSETESILGAESYTNVNEDRAGEEDVYRAVYVEGNYIGKMVYIRLKTFSKEQIEIKPVVDMKEARQIGKIKKEARMICLDEIKKGFGNNNTKLLDYYIVDSMANPATNGWPYKEQVKWLQENFKFTPYTEDPTSNDQRKKWISDNMGMIPQPAIKLTVWLHFMSTKNAATNEHKIYEIAEYCGVPGNEASFIAEAEKRVESAKSIGVDAKEEKPVEKKEKEKKEKKEKKAKAEKPNEAAPEPESEQPEPVIEVPNEQPQDVEQPDAEQMEKEEAKSSTVIAAEEMEELYQDEEELEHSFDQVDEFEEEEEQEEEEYLDPSNLPRANHHHDY